MNPYGTSLIDLSDPAKPVILPARSSQPGVNLCFAVTRFDGQYQLTASIMHPHISRIGAKSILAGNSISVYTGVHLPLPDTVQSEEDKNLFLASEEAETLVEAAVQEANTHRYPQKSGFLAVPAQAEYLTLNPYLAQGEVVDLKRYALAMMERPILSARSWQGKLIPLWPGIYRVIAPHLPEGEGFYVLYTPAHRAKIANVLNDIYTRGGSSPYVAYPDVRDDSLDKTDVEAMATYAIKYTDGFTFTSKLDIFRDPIFTDERFLR